MTTSRHRVSIAGAPGPRSGASAEASGHDARIAVPRDEQVQPATGRPAGWRRRLPDAITGAVVLAMIGFVLGGIGIQLAGVRVLADTSSLTVSSVYRDGGMPQTSSGTLGLNDTIDAATPNEVLFGTELRNGVFADWNPYALGGAPLAATPNFGLLSPLAAPFWLLPGWLAPAYVKLLECIVAIGGTYLFLRRLRLRPAAACLGGTIFASSAFIVAWTGWPQTRTAVVIPALFWSLDRLAERLRWREAALVSLAVMCLLLGGFPSVTGYALLTGAAYLAVRLLAQRPLRWPVVVARSAAAAGAVLAGIAATAWQLVPFAQYLGTALIRGRDQVSGQHIPVEALLTTIAPYALGTASARNAPTWFAPGILVEGESYIGAAALVLGVAAVALAGRARALLPRGVWWFLVAATLGWGVVIYLGGAPLGLLQRTGYLFSDNFIGRARSILGLLVAALAAVGFELLLRRREEHTVNPLTRASRAYGLGVWLAVASGGAVVYLVGRRLATARGTTTVSTAGAVGPDQAVSDLTALNRQLAIGLLLAALTGAAVAWLWFGRQDGLGRRRRALVTAAVVLIPALVAGQALAWVLSYYPHSKRANFYPTNAVHDYLAAHLGHERFYGTAGAIYGSLETIHGLRQFHGHGFMEQEYGELADALPGRQFPPPPRPATIIVGESGDAAEAVAHSPILDRASVTEYIAPPEVQPFGDLHPTPTDGSNVTLTLGHPVTVEVPTTGPLRGIGITPTGSVGPTLRQQIDVALRDADGTLVAEASRVDREVAAGVPFVVPLAADTLGGSLSTAGPQLTANTRLTATITLKGFSLVGAPPAPPPRPWTIAARQGTPAITVVTPRPNDGLRLAFDGQSVIYHRTTALPRARWASSTVVVPDAPARLKVLASGRLTPDQVVLNSPGAPAEGQPATVDWMDDDLDELSLRVDAHGAGYVVVADAIQHGWKATVDGHPAAIVPADHAFAAVSVPAGRHTVRFVYAPARESLGVAITLVTVLGLLLAAGIEWRRERARRSRRG